MLDKMSDLEVDGVKYPIVFNLNVMEIIQEEYGSITRWSDLIEKKGSETDIRALKFGIGAMINEGIDIENEKSENKRDFLTAKQVGRIVSEYGFAKMTKKALQTVIESTEEPKSKNE